MDNATSSELLGRSVGSGQNAKTSAHSDDSRLPPIPDVLALEIATLHRVT